MKKLEDVIECCMCDNYLKDNDCNMDRYNNAKDCNDMEWNEPSEILSTLIYEYEKIINKLKEKLNEKEKDYKDCENYYMCGEVTEKACEYCGYKRINKK